MKGAGQQLTRYIKDEVSIGVHKEKRNRYNSKKYAVVFRHAVDWYELIIKEIRAYADKEASNSMRDIPQRIIEKPQPKWKLTKRYVNEYRNSCNVESCPCDSKPSEECITHMKSIRML